MTTALLLLLALVGVLALCALHWRLVALELTDEIACLVERLDRLTHQERDMPPVELTRNADGTWTARIFSVRFTGTYQQCLTWLRANGETV